MKQSIEDQVKTTARKHIEHVMKGYLMNRGRNEQDAMAEIELKLGMTRIDADFDYEKRDSAVKEIVETMKLYGMRPDKCYQVLSDYTGYTYNSIKTFANTNVREYATIKK